MIARFCAYSVLKNLRFADPFLVLFLLHLGLSMAAIGSLLGGQHLLTGVLEVPLGAVADRWGRRRSLALGFLCYLASFALFASVSEVDWARLVMATGLFGLGEALRSGSHKAIILDYLEQRSESERAAEVIGLTRSFSKATSGSAALAGGFILYASGSYTWLFALSAVAAAGGFALMLSYPRSLEGEQSRAGKAMGSARALVREPGVVPLVVQSTLFESQVKILLKYYLAPFLQVALAAVGLSVMAWGAVAIGAVEMLRDGLGSVASRQAVRLRTAAGGAASALRIAYLGAVLAAAALTWAAGRDALWLGVPAAVALSVLQNARRPVFVSAFDDVLDKPQRATSLSIESLARTVVVAALLPLVGSVADRVGLWAAFAALLSVLALGLLIPLGTGHRDHT